MSRPILATLSAASLLLVLPARSESQQQDSITIPWSMWGSFAVGPSNGPDGEGRLGANLSLWVARGFGAISVRRAGSTRALEAGDAYDTSVLVGVRRISYAGQFAVAGVGLGRGGGSNASGSLRNEGVIALGAQAGFDFHFAAVGLDAFAALGSTRRYAAIGLALAVGKFH